MKRKIIVTALAGIFCAPAAVLAATNVTLGDIEVYGRLDANLESVKNDRATGATSLNRLMTNASRFGVRGNKELGGDLKVIYQLEAGFDLNGANAAANNGQAGLATTRNSNIGLKGNFGTVFMGNWDTPYFVSHDPVELFGNTTVATGVNLTGRVANAATPIANFNNHQNTVVQYWSPSISGFQAKIAYAPDNNKTVTQNKSVLSLSASYDNDSFYGAYGFESHKDGSFTGQTDKANRLVGAYKVAGALISLTYERLTVGTAATSTASRNGIELGGKYKIGANNLGIVYSKAGDLGGAANTGASQYSLRYGYDLGSDTEAYGFYTSLTNKANATYNFKDGAILGTAGSKLSGFGVGLAHNF
ncbi:MAG TPA: porin [Gallionella sp.]|nr:porin [Gallionella sp.]